VAWTQTDDLGEGKNGLLRFAIDLVFPGKGTPPPELAGSAHAVAKVAAGPSGIAYVDKGSVTGAVKVVLSLP
jgi:hypothetical protein